MTDQYFIRRTFSLARTACEAGGRPFATMIVVGNDVLCEVKDEPDWRNVPTKHPEIEALRNFCETHHKSDLKRATLYTNVEPCPMCAGAIMYSGVERLVFSVSRDKFDQWIAHCRRRPRKRCLEAKTIICNGGITTVRGPLLENEGLILLKSHCFPFSFQCQINEFDPSYKIGRG